MFFIEKGGTPYEQVIGRYAGDTISAADKGEMDFLDGGIDDIQVKNKVYLGDNHAEALQKQIRSYMGRVVTKEQLQKVLHSSNDLKKVEKSAKNIETTVENQKKAGGWHYGGGRYDNLRAGICKDVRYRRVQGAEFWCH